LPSTHFLSILYPSSIFTKPIEIFTALNNLKDKRKRKLTSKIPNRNIASISKFLNPVVVFLSTPLTSHVIVMARPPSQASVLFTPLELRVYQRWRSLYVYEIEDDDFTPVPNAFEYAAYKEWRANERAQDLPQNSMSASDVCETESEIENEEAPKAEEEVKGFVIAEKCRHPLHPAHVKQRVPGYWIEDGEIPDTPSHCPVCTLALHRNLIEALSEKWKELGAPWRRAAITDNDERAKYSETLRAYHKAKVALVNAMRGFEEAVEEEKEWEVAHPERDVEIVKEHGAKKALEQYETGIAYPARLAEPDQVLPATPSSKRARTKHQTYSYDTPNNTKHRPQGVWLRGGSSYDADSPHACPSDEGYWDTSYYRDWRFAISQCRILLVRYDSDTGEPQYSDKNTGPYRRLTNPHVRALIKLVERGIRNATLNEQCLQQMGSMFLVWHNGSRGEEMFNAWSYHVTLVGTVVEAYARRAGDIDDAEWAARETAEVEEEGEVAEVAEARPWIRETGQESAVEEHLPSWNYGDKDEGEVVLTDPKDLEEEEYEMEDAVETPASCKVESNPEKTPSWVDPESER
jgi:hypothetical protein